MEYKDIVDDCLFSIKTSLERERDDVRDTIKKAWKRSIEGSSSGRLLVPFIGSGLNKLVKEGDIDWGKLVDVFEKGAGIPIKKHEIEDARLSYPERLEISLDYKKKTKQKINH